LRKPSLSVLYQRNLLACWILQAVADQQEEWPLQPGQRMALPTGSVFGTCAEGSLATQQASFVDHVAVVLEHFLGLLDHLQEAYLQAGALQGRSCQEWVACRPGRASSCFAL
jgi:hypothetical protein